MYQEQIKSPAIVSEVTWDHLEQAIYDGDRLPNPESGVKPAVRRALIVRSLFYTTGDEANFIE